MEFANAKEMSLCLSSVLDTIAPEAPPNLVAALSAIANACASIARSLRTSDADAKAGTENKFGDQQLVIDLSTDRAVFHHLKLSKVIAVGSSEETVEEVNLGGEGPDDTLYSVGFDPLDGSSIVDANFSVGGIFGIWPGRGLLGRTGREQAAAVMAIFGPRTTMAIGLNANVCGASASSSPAGPGTAFEITLQDDGQSWLTTRPKLTIAPMGKVFAPGNLRATSDNPRYAALVQHWISTRYTLRYTGGLVPDVYHILIKGKGVMSNVSSPTAKAKLRLLYEAAPIAFVVESAGGRSATAPSPTAPDAAGVQSLLDIPIADLDLRLGVCYGSAEEVEKYIAYMYGDEGAGAAAGAP